MAATVDGSVLAGRFLYGLDEKLLGVKFPSTTSETHCLIPSRGSYNLLMYTNEHNLLCSSAYRVCFFVENLKRERNDFLVINAREW